MPKLCEGCGFYSADNAPTACPTCATALKFTFLPPAGRAAAPFAGLPTDPVAELSRRHRADGGSRIHWGLVKAVCAALVTVGIMGVRFYLRMERRADRDAAAAVAEGPKPVEALRVGLHISDAARLIDAGSGAEVPGRTRFRDRFGPADDSDGSVETDAVRVVWRNGYVTAVEPRAGGAGGGGAADDGRHPGPGRGRPGRRGRAAEAGGGPPGGAGG